jgi:hypothetical protein
MRKFFIATALIISTLSVIAQEEPKEKEGEKESPIFFEKPKPAWQQKLRFGGNFWLNFWNALYVDASPMAGYELTDKGTVAGLGVAMIYQGSIGRNSNRDNSFAYGPRFFVRQQIYKPVFAHLEYELINARNYQFNSFSNPTGAPITSFTRKWEGAPYIGLGFYQGRGNRGRGSFIMVMYNLTYPDRGFISPLQFGGDRSPLVLRLGFF